MGLSTAILSIAIFAVIAYPLSVGPVFRYYENKDGATVSTPMARAIFKMYVPLYKIAPSITSWYVGTCSGLSDIETYLLMNHEQYPHASVSESTKADNK